MDVGRGGAAPGVLLCAGAALTVPVLKISEALVCVSTLFFRDELEFFPAVVAETKAGISLASAQLLPASWTFHHNMFFPLLKRWEVAVHGSSIIHGRLIANQDR